jgi:hypothetical protein
MAKKADEVGNTHQLDRWRQGLKTAGLQLSISRSGQQVDRHTAEVRLDILFERLDVLGHHLGDRSARRLDQMGGLRVRW